MKDRARETESGRERYGWIEIQSQWGRKRERNVERERERKRKKNVCVSLVSERVR